MSFLITWGAVPAIGPVLSASPASWAAGSVELSAGAVTQLLTVANMGDANLVIGTLAISGAGFSLSADGVSGATIAVGGSRTVLLSYNPSAAGSVSGTLTIPSNAPSTPNLIGLTGTGYAAGTDPQWAIDLRAVFAVAGITYATTTMPVGTYSGAQVNAAIVSTGSGSSATNHKRLTVASGSTITLSGDTGLLLQNLSNFTLQLTGVTINQNTIGHGGGSNFSSAIFVANCTRVAVRGGTIIGQNTATGTANAYSLQDEWINGFNVRAGCHYIEFDSITQTKCRGWPIFIGVAGTGGPPDNIWMHNCTNTGGEDWAMVSGSKWLCEDNTGNDHTYFGVDLEPDTSSTDSDIADVMIQRNTFRRFGWVNGLFKQTCWILAGNHGLSNGPYSSMVRITFRDNLIPEGHVAGLATTVGQGNDGKGGLLVRFNQNTQPKSDIVITGNISSQACTRAGGTMDISYVNNLTVTGNTQITIGHVPLMALDSNNTGTHVVTPNTV